MAVQVASHNGETHEMEDEEVNFSDSQLVEHFREVLESVVDPTSVAYDTYEQLLAVLHPSYLGPEEVALLVTSLRALCGVVSYIDNTRHGRLLSSIFAINLWKHGTDVMDALLELIICLAASNTKYIELCMNMLVESFMPPKYLVDTLNQPRGVARKEQVLTRVHSALHVLVDLVPLAALTLSSIVVHRIPTISRKDCVTGHQKYCTEIYVKNMLTLESGALREFVGSNILMAVMDMLIELDAVIAWDDIMRDDSCKGIFTMEIGEDDGATTDDGEGNDDHEIPKTLSQKILGKNATADLLDSLMVLIFEHLEACARDNRLTEVFKILLDSFMVTTLNMYKPKFTQFVMFYTCSLDPGKCGVKFAKELADKFVCSENSAARMNAVAYLASYLARGKFLEASFVVRILKRLVDWCSVFCKTQGSEVEVFYHGCQAIMYVLCFHMRSIMDDPELKQKLLSMPIEPILKHKLEPLRVCHADIVKEFLEQAKAARLFTVSRTFIFQDLLADSSLSTEWHGRKRLESFSPFDPCLLEKCDRGFLQPKYLYWKYVRSTYHSNEEDSSDEDFMEEGTTGRNVDEEDFDIDEFDFAMNKMSITPNNRSIDGFMGEKKGMMMPMPSRLRPSTSPESL